MSAVRSFVRLLIKTLRRLMNLAFLLAIVGLLARFGLQWRHPKKWDSWLAIKELHRYVDPAITKVGSFLELAWPSSSTRLLPLGLAVAVLIVMLVAGAILGRVLDFVQRPVAVRARPRAPEPAAEQLRKETVQPSAPPVAAAAEFSDRTVLASSSPRSAETEPRMAASMTQSTVLEQPPAGAKKIVERIGQYEILRIGRYEVIREVGRGAMGVVYKAQDRQLDRIVAIKSILAGDASPEEFEQYKRRFYREAKAAGQMSHPGIVTIHDITEDERGQPCMVMEYVEGDTLAALGAAERLPFARVAEIGIQMADALDYAHGRGVIHRDIKPANILVTRDGKAKITDFGIAKIEGSQLTRTGQVLGTPAFMSPEQFTGAAVDSRTDIFSLGSLLYWLCTGEKPFPGETVSTIAFNVVQRPPVSACQLNPALPEGIDLVLSRCLAKSPDQRYTRAHELALDLQKFRADRRGAATQRMPPGTSEEPPPEPSS